MSDSEVWKDTQYMFLETEKMLRESLVKFNLVTNFPSPQLPSSHSTFITPSISQTSSLEKQFSNTTTPNDTTAASLVNKPLHKSEQFDAQRFNIAESLQRLELCRKRNFKQRSCKNVSRGCDVKRKGNMNLFMSTSKKFRPFCKSFIKKYNVHFLYKKNSNDNGIKVCVCGYIKRYKFIIRFMSQDFTIIHKIVGFTDSDIYEIPTQIMDNHGPFLSYQIRLQK